MKIKLITCAAFALMLLCAQAAIAEDKCYELGQSGQHRQAIQACTDEINSGLNTGRNLAVLYVNRGADYGAIGQYDNAIADFSKALELDPSNINAHDGRGAAYVLKGQYDLALADFKKVIQMDPSMADYYIGVGLFDQKEGSGGITAPGRNNHNYRLVTVDASACSKGGSLIITGVVGQGQSAASFDIFLQNQPVTVSGRPVSCGHTYDLRPGSSYLVSCTFPSGQKLTFGAEGNWFSPVGSANTYTYHAIVNCR